MSIYFAYLAMFTFIAFIASFGIVSYFMRHELRQALLEIRHRNQAAKEIQLATDFPSIKERISLLKRGGSLNTADEEIAKLFQDYVQNILTSHSEAFKTEEVNILITEHPTAPTMDVLVDRSTHRVNKARIAAPVRYGPEMMVTA